MVTYFRPNDLKRCLASVLTNTREPYHLSILDNSCGGIDDALDIADPHVTVYRNPTNLGKGRAVMAWYATIMKDNPAPYFISIDPDLEIPAGWLTRLELAAARLRDNPLGVLAPTIVDDAGDTFDKQLARGTLVMHKRSDTSAFVFPTVYRNRYTAGPLFLIDRTFFEAAGGYAQTQLYGNDDGELCRAAAKRGRFTGIVTDVVVRHLAADVTPGYRLWKARNIGGDTDGRGYWD